MLSWWMLIAFGYCSHLVLPVISILIQNTQLFQTVTEFNQEL